MEHLVSILSGFQHAKNKNPSGIAVEDGDRQLSYSELDQQSNQFAHGLVENGVKAGSVVGLLLPRSWQLVVASLAIVKCGAVIAPLDRHSPAPRLDAMIKNIDCGLVIGNADEFSISERQVLPFDAILLDDSFEDFAPTLREKESPAFIFFTSGSTGAPKAVLVPERGVLRLAKPDYIPFTADMRFANVSNPSFDAINFDMWAPLLTGGTCVIIPDPIMSDFDAFTAFLRSARIDTMFMTVSLFNAIVAECPQCFDKLETLLIGGEQINTAIVMQWYKNNSQSNCTIYNVYGPTECATFSLSYPIPRNELRENAPIGRPLPGTQVLIVSADLTPTATGQTGELLLAGEAVCLGYHNRDDADAAAFVFIEGIRFYRTGDQVIQNGDGTISFVGRIGRQVKIRGFRVEPGEIETKLNAHPIVQNSHVTTCAAASGVLELHAYLVMPTDIDIGVFQDYLRAQLPSYMVPHHLYRVERIPTTANGKVDRKSLLENDTPRWETAKTGGYHSPEIVKALSIARQILQQRQISASDSFMRMGGDSLAALRYKHQLARELGIDVTVRNILHDSIEDLICNSKPFEQDDLPVAAKWQNMERATSEQKRLWLHAQRNPTSLAYSVPLIYRIEGKIDAHKLAASFENLFASNPAFQTAFVEIDSDLMQIRKPKSECSFHEFAVGQYCEENWEEFASGIFNEIFDLAKPALFKAYWLPFDADSGVLLVNAHHIVLDGWSLNLVLRALTENYQGISSGVANTYPDMAQFARWQQDQFTRPQYAEERQDLVEHWTSGFASDLPLSPLRTAEETIAKVSHFALDQTASKNVHLIAQKHGVTPFNVYLAAFCFAFSHVSGRERFVTATPVSNRDNPAFADTIGMIANTVLLPVSINQSQSMAESLQKNWQTWQPFLAHEQIAFEHLVDDLAAADFPHSGEYDCMFVLENTDYESLLFPGCKTRYQPPKSVDGKIPLTVFLLDREDGPELVIETQNRFFSSAGATRFATCFEKSLSALETTEKLLGEIIPQTNGSMSGPEIELTSTTIAQMLLEQCKASPDTTAVISGQMKTSYRELFEYSWSLAHDISTQLPNDNTPRTVGLFLDPSLEHIVAVLALAQLNITILPLDPSYPPAMHKAIVSKAAPDLVLTSAFETRLQSFDCKSVPFELKKAKRPAPAPHAGQHPLYLLHTSGSTGEPKGVKIYDDALCNLLLWQKKFGGLDEPAITQQFSKLSFDVCFQEIFTTLTSGGTLTLITTEMQSDPVVLLNAMRDTKVERIFLPFVALKMLAEAATKNDILLPHLRHVISAGEALVCTKEIKAWFDTIPDAKLSNHYGPSETHVVCANTLPSNVNEWPDIAPIGQPVANVTLQIAFEEDQNGNPDESGELLISGKYVRHCYTDAQDNQKNFISDKNGAVQYRTGDRVAVLRNDYFNYLGRRDGQIKVSGHRVELQQIEAKLNAAPDIVLSVVMIAPDGTLRGFIQSTDAPTSLTRINEILAKQLPDYIRLNTITQIDEWPKAPSGKIDRRALLNIDASNTTPAPISHSTSVWADETDAKLADLFAQVVHREILPKQSFFDAGATSLDLIRYRDACQTAFDTKLTIAELFQNSSVSKLSARIYSDKPKFVSKQAHKTGSKADEKMAIVGMSVNVAGAENLAAFKELIVGNKYGIEHFAAANGAVGARSQLKRMLGFDPAYFNISQQEAKMMDPQQRHLLMGAVHCLQDAGINGQYSNERIGVIASAGENTYFQDMLRIADPSSLPDAFQMALHHDKDFLATKLSYRLGLTGPALSVQAACGSSLIGLHIASGMLAKGDCDAMLVGGCLVDPTLTNGYTYRPQHIFSKDGFCRPFDKDASGTVGASGYGFVLLKPYSRAVADGNKIYAIVEGSAINNDGNDKMSYAAPSVQGQSEVLSAALKNAGLPPDQVEYIEAHGTGTLLGDPIEIAAVQQAYGERTSPLTISSLKSQIGHLGAAAGLVGLIRAVVSIDAKIFPPNLNYKTQNPEIVLDSDIIRIPATAQPWVSKSKRRAGISSFGIGGTNAHAIVAEAEHAPAPAPAPAPVVILSAQTKASLELWGKQISEYLENNPEQYAQVLQFLQFGTPQLGYRSGFVSADAQEAIQKLRDLPDVRKILPGEVVEHAGLNAAKMLKHWYAGNGFKNEKRAAPAPAKFPLYPFELQDFTFETKAKSVGEPKSENLDRLPPEKWLFAPSWVSMGRLKPAHPRKAIAILLHADDLDLTQQEALAHTYERTISLQLGDEFKKRATDNYSISLAIQDFEQIAKDLGIKSDVLVDFINLAPAQLPSQIDQQALDAAQTCCFDVMPGIAALTKNLRSAQFRLINISVGASGLSGQVDRPLAGLLAGATHVVPLELNLPTYWFDFEDQELTDLTATLSQQELAPGRYGVSKGIIWSRGTSSVQQPSTRLNELAPTTYLVVGGSGGIGQNVCHELLVDPNCRVEITTRTGELPNDFAQYGDRMRVHKLDLTDSRIEWPSFSDGLDGIVFCAGVGAGSAIETRDAGAMRAANGVKTVGIASLETLIEKEQPSWVAYCSSMASQYGGRGQLDYAGTNGLLDSIANWVNPKAPNTRRTAINWDIWREAGMAVSALKNDDFHQKHLSYGLSNNEGRTVFRSCLNLTRPQIFVSTIALDEAASLYGPASKPKQAENSAPLNTGHQIPQILCRLLSSTHVPLDCSLEQLGMDSLTTLDLIDEIRAHDGPTFGLSDLPPTLKVDELIALVSRAPSGSERIDMLYQMIANLIGKDDFEITDSFGALGLDSLLALDLMDAIKQEFDATVSLAVFHEEETLDGLLRDIGATQGDIEDTSDATFNVSVDCWQQGDGTRAICFVHPVGGETIAYKPMFNQLDDGVTVFAISDPNLAIETPVQIDIAERAAAYLGALRRKANRKTAQFELVGWSFGAWVAQEMSVQAEQHGPPFSNLTMIDPPEPDCGSRMEDPSEEDIQTAFLYDLAPRLKGHQQNALTLDNKVAPELQYHLRKIVRCCKSNMQSMRGHTPNTLVRTSTSVYIAAETAEGLLVSPISPAYHLDKWRKKITKIACAEILPADHYSIMKAPSIDFIAGNLFSKIHNDIKLLE